MDGNGRPAWVSDVLAMESRLMARVDRLEDTTTRRLEAIEQKLDGKADANALSALERRVAALEADHLRWSLPRVLGGSAVLYALSALVGGLISRLLG